MRVGAAIRVLLALSGCATYMPSSLDEIAPGNAVVVSVSRHAQLDIVQRVAIDEWRLQGRIVSVTPEAVVVSVRNGDRNDRFVRDSNEPLRQWIDVARSDVVAVEIRRVDALKTAGAVSLAVVVLTAVTLAGLNSGS
jgi:hypothetical protein